MKPALCSLLFIALLAALPLAAFPQETTGSIEGYAVGEAGGALAAVTVTAAGQDVLGSMKSQSATDGYFAIYRLPVGTYSVVLSHSGFQETELTDVSVTLGKTTNLGQIHLASRVDELPAMVVTARPLLIDPWSTAFGSAVSSSEFKDLPLDRNYRNITTLLPHANESFLGDEVNYAGGTGQENKYFIDGVETTDPYLALTGTNLPYNFVKDVVVRTGGYEAEYRSSLGGIVDVVSQTGGNEFHGQAFGFFVNNQFAGDSRAAVIDPRTGDFAQYDAGLGVGGPIKRDKLWFFAAYNPQVSREDVEIPGTGVYEDKSTAHIFAGKLDWKPSSATDLSLTVTGDPTVRDAVGELFGGSSPPVAFENPDPFLVDLTTGGVNVLARGMHRFSSNLFLEASVSGITRKLKYEASTERGRNERTFVDKNGVWSGGYMTPTDDQSLEVTADVKMTLALGKHLLKSGLAYRDNRLEFNEEFYALFQYSDSLYEDFVFTALDGTVRNRIPSVFVQDSWRVTERLRLNAGLRWDGQFLVGTDGKVAQKITDQYQPRIGVVYQPGKLGTQKIFGSYGRYYQELALALSVLEHNDTVIFEIVDYDHDPRVDPSGPIPVLEEHGSIQNEVEDLKGQHFDEFTLGYERQLGDRFTLGARGIYRTLREGIEDGYVESVGDFVYGNPGRGLMSEFPKMTRDYTALELTAQLFGSTRYSARGSYVLSRTRGNYPGLYDSDTGIVFSNVGAPFDLAEQVSTGLLPNDRTHVFKLSGAYRLTRGLTGGALFTWETGTPLSVFVPSSVASWPRFSGKRGTAGRTPSLWDLNLRFVYDLTTVLHSRIRPRFVLDIFHVASQRKAVNFDQLKYLTAGEYGFAPPLENPTYGTPTRYQPPMAVRLGMEVGF